MANATAQPEGVIGKVAGPGIEFWTNLPPVGKVGLVAAAGVIFLGYMLWQNKDSDQELEASDWADRMENMLKSPTEQNGAPINQLLIKQSNSAAKRTIGKVKKLEETKTPINKDGQLPDNSKKPEDVDLEEYEAVTYSFIRGRKKIDRIINDIIYKVRGIFSNGSNPAAEYLDIGTNHLEMTDRGIVIDPNVHLFKKNGLWQVADPKDQARINQLSFVASHQNYLESLQQHPEFYSDLNMNVSGTKNIMNQKSENMREYKKEERQKEIDEAMN